MERERDPESGAGGVVKAYFDALARDDLRGMLAAINGMNAAEVGRA